MATTLITPQIRALIGTDSPPERNRFPISEEMAYDLADATEDPNPLYSVPDHARRSRFGGILCPPLATWKDIAPPIGFFGAGQESHFEVPLPFNSYGLNGGSDWQFLRPCYVGDWITMRSRAGPDPSSSWCARKPKPTIKTRSLAWPTGLASTERSPLGTNPTMRSTWPTNCSPYRCPHRGQTLLCRGRWPKSRNNACSKRSPWGALGSGQWELRSHSLGPALRPASTGPVQHSG